MMACLQTGQNDDKLIAAETGDKIGFAYYMRQPAGDLPQQFVTDLMAQRVIDELEAVEIHEHDRQLPAVATRFR